MTKRIISTEKRSSLQTYPKSIRYCDFGNQKDETSIFLNNVLDWIFKSKVKEENVFSQDEENWDLKASATTDIHKKG